MEGHYVIGVGSGYEVLVDNSCWEWKVRDGRSVRFWMDMWCGSMILKDRFPISFLLSNANEATVHQSMSKKGNNNLWDFKWRRDLFEWEKEEEKHLQS